MHLPVTLSKTFGSNEKKDPNVQSHVPDSIRDLPRHQIHWDNWPTEFEKMGHFRKYHGPMCLLIQDSYLQFFIIEEIMLFACT